MQITKINAYPAVSTNNKQKVQNNKANVSFGILGPRYGGFLLENFSYLEKVFKDQGKDFKKLFCEMKDNKKITIDTLEDGVYLYRNGKQSFNIGPAGYNNRHNRPNLFALYDIEGVLKEISGIIKKPQINRVKTMANKFHNLEQEILSKTQEINELVKKILMPGKELDSELLKSHEKALKELKELQTQQHKSDVFFNEGSSKNS